MKKIILIILFVLLFIPISVRADDIYNVDMDIYIDEFGNAQITEVWNVKADSGSEWYKQLYNMGNSKISDFVVYMDGNKLQSKKWNVDEGISQKAGYYGINYVDKGLELCFGKKDFLRHTFILKYTLSNFIINTSDSQILYQTFLPNVTLDDFTVDISSFYNFPDTLDVWGYGYKGYAYVKNGKISMSNEGTLNNNYVVLLAKFPLNTFNTGNEVFGYNNFEDIKKMASEGTYEYDYGTNDGNFFTNVIIPCFKFFSVLFIIYTIIKSICAENYGYVNNKKIVKKNVPLFRDIPCNKDIYYANALIQLNNFANYKECNILGAIILKWVKENKIVFRDEKVKQNDKYSGVIDLTKDVTFDNENEKILFDMMRVASKDGLLEANELTKWCKKNYSKFLDLFTKLKNDKINELKNIGYIYRRVNKKECKYKNVMNNQLYNDSVQLYGLKKFLDEFSRIDTKEVMEVKLWDEYLMFAFLFGMADKVAKQLKDMYPEVVEQMNNQGLDYNRLVYINSISSRSISAASNARDAAQGYSSGGGGFSSGGGGGGSFGGGGSMGGR